MAAQPATTQFGKYTIAALLLLTFCLESHCVPYFRDLNRTSACVHGTVQWESPCHHGYFEYKQYPVCPKEYICFRGPSETCADDNSRIRCKDGLTCKCGICQNCDENLCIMDLCISTSINNVLKRWMKRFERNRMEYKA